MLSAASAYTPARNSVAKRPEAAVDEGAVAGAGSAGAGAAGAGSAGAGVAALEHGAARDAHEIASASARISL
jgi:hypothetical protein